MQVLKYIGRSFLVIFTIVIAILIILMCSIYMISKGPSPAASKLFVTTVLESGQMKFLAKMFLSAEEINEIVGDTSMQAMDADVNTEMINIGITGSQTENESSESATVLDPDGIEIVEISGRTYFAKMMIVNDPSRVTVGTTYPFSEYGLELDKIAAKYNAVGAINGGLYVSTGNKGGSPLGIVVSGGDIQYNNPAGYAGLYIIGFDADNILQIISVEGKSAAELKTIVEEKRIRDAVAFQDEASDANNHFVPLIINGEAREMNGSGSGANPRTVIGQRADGAVLLLVTDGRGSAGHLGATAADLISIMKEYGAVNAANLDGGSSSCMVYEGEYEMTSVTLYYSNSSWLLPTAFIVNSRQ